MAPWSPNEVSVSGRWAVAVLAAGSSSRYGTLKQLAPVSGRPMITHAVTAALAASPDRVLVVTGYESERVAQALQSFSVEVLANPGWQDGMASSVRAAARALADFDTLVITLADQPFVTATHIAELARTCAEGSWDAVATNYQGSAGVPCAFRSSLFPQLSILEGDQGAKSLLNSGTLNVHLLDFTATQDVDTANDFDDLQL